MISSQSLLIFETLCGRVYVSHACVCVGVPWVVQDTDEKNEKACLRSKAVVEGGDELKSVGPKKDLCDLTRLTPCLLNDVPLF